jgi:hypothetical protein
VPGQSRRDWSRESSASIRDDVVGMTEGSQK